MKKLICILEIILGIIFLLCAMWFHIQINNVCTVKDGIMYDGFGYQYVYEEPHCPYAICIYIFGFLGLATIGTGRENLIKLRDNTK